MVQPMIEIAAVLGAAGTIDFSLLCAAVFALDLFRACGGVLYLWESAKYYWHALAPCDEVLVIRSFLPMRIRVISSRRWQGKWLTG